MTARADYHAFGLKTYIHHPNNMKKTLSLLALGAIAIGATVSAADTVTVKAQYPIDDNGQYEVQSPNYGANIAPGATLIDTATGKVTIYDEADDIDVIKAPFELNEGMSVTTLQLDLSDVELGGANKLVLDFSEVSGRYQPQNWGVYLQADYTADYTGDYIADDVDYLLITIKGVDFASWYSENSPVEIIGRFSTGFGSVFETTAFVITEPCDLSYEGSVVFFSEDVIDEVRAIETVPEPTTATLSLLALAGLVARRRRK